MWILYTGMWKFHILMCHDFYKILQPTRALKPLCSCSCGCAKNVQFPQSKSKFLTKYMNNIEDHATHMYTKNHHAKLNTNNNGK